MLFVDMLRPNRFGIYNKDLEFNEIDKIISRLGGTLYTNCFSPGPDTPRSMACFYSGLYPHLNGCDTRVKYPGKFLKNDVSTIFDIFLKENYETHFFSNPNERKGGLFPSSISDLEIHNEDFDLKKYLEKISLQQKHLVFLSIPDYHWALGDWGYTSKGEKEAIKETSRSLEIVFNKFDPDDFDHIFLFSDHGFKFSSQFKYESWHEFLNRDRSNIFLLHRKKGDSDISYNDKLSSIKDISNTIDELFSKKNELSLLSEIEREYVVIEDHLSISAPKVNQDVDLWGVMTKDEMYARTLTEAVTVKNNKVISDLPSQHFDEILRKESQFGRYQNEYNKVFDYHKYILAQTSYMNGNKRPDDIVPHKLSRNLEKLKDKIKYSLLSKYKK